MLLEIEATKSDNHLGLVIGLMLFLRGNSMGSCSGAGINGVESYNSVLVRVGFELVTVVYDLNRI